MGLLLSIFSIIFVLSLILVERFTNKELNATNTPITTYFRSSLRWFQSVMFIALAVILIFVSINLTSLSMAIAIGIVGVSLIGIMVTGVVFTPAPDYNATNVKPWLYAHYIITAICFISAYIAMFLNHDYTYLLSCLSVIWLLFGINTSRYAVMEKVSVLMMIIWMFGFGLQLM